MGSLFDWSTTAGDNDDADSDINWIEGQAGATVNNSARAMMAKIAGLVRALKGSYTTAGSSTAYTLTVDFPPSSLASKGWFGLIRFHTANGATPSIDINSLGAVAIYMNDGAAPAAGELAEDSVHFVHYDTETSRLRVLTSGASALVASDISDFNTAVAALIVTIDEMTAETAPAVDDYLGIYDTSATAQRKMTFENFLKVITSLTGETAPAIADEVPVYDASATAPRKMTLENILKVINGLTAETAPAVGDLLVIYDTSATAPRKMTPENWLKILNSLTEDTSPDKTADFVLTYDTSAGTVKKVKPSNLASGATYLGSITTTSGASQSLSGLTLTNYKVIELWFMSVSHNSGAAIGFQVGNSTSDDVTCTDSTGAANTCSGILKLDIVNGVGVFAGNDSTSVGEGMSKGITSHPITTSSTAISVAPVSASFDGGVIHVYAY